MISFSISRSISLISFQWMVEIGWCTVLASCNIIIYLVIAVDSWQKVVEDFCRYDSFRNDARSKWTQHCRRIQYVNSLWPSGVTWWHRSWSTLAQVMTCCLMAPSHSLNKCWLLISEGFFCIHLRVISQGLLLCMNLKIILLKSLPHFMGAHVLPFWCWHQWPLLLTWFNFKPSMDK